MTGKNKKYKKAELQIINAYADLINKNDDSFTVENLLAEANISRPAFYSHFKSMDKIIDRIEEIAVEKFNTFCGHSYEEHINNLLEHYMNIANFVKQHLPFIKKLCNSKRIGQITSSIAMKMADKAIHYPELTKLYEKTTESYMLETWLEAYSLASTSLNVWVAVIKREYKIDYDFIANWCADYHYRVTKDWSKKHMSNFEDKHYLDDFYKRNKE